MSDVDIFCTPVQRAPRSSTKKLSLSHNKNKANHSNNACTFLTQYGIDFANGQDQEPFYSSQQTDILDDDESGRKTFDRPHVDCENSSKQNEACLGPKIKVKSFALYTSPKEEKTSHQFDVLGGIKEDPSIVITLDSDDDEKFDPCLSSQKCSKSVKCDTPKKKYSRKKSPSTTSKIEVRRKLTKSTNLKKVTSKYFDSSQKRIDNFFKVEKRSKSIGYYETFQKSEIKDFETHTSQAANCLLVQETAIERMKEASGRIFIDVCNEEDEDIGNNFDSNIEKKIEQVIDLCYDSTPPSPSNENKENKSPGTERQNSDNSENSLKPADTKISKTNENLNKTTLPETDVDCTNIKNANKTRTRKKECSQNIFNASLESDISSEINKRNDNLVTSTDDSDFIVNRPRRACKRLSFSSTTTPMNSKLGSSKTVDSGGTSRSLASNSRLKAAIENAQKKVESHATSSQTSDSTLTAHIESVEKKLDSRKRKTGTAENRTPFLKKKNLHKDVLLSPVTECSEIDLTIQTPNQNNLLRTPIATVRKLNSKLLSTRSKNNSCKTSNRKKRNRRIECPEYKVIEGTTFAVDGFRFGEIEGVTHYFLTHFHADHYIGLKKSFSKPIYLSVITGKLVEKFIGTDKQYLHPLEIGKSIMVENIEVTAIDANHCPGAVMFLFRFSTGLCTLHTGDFRASMEMEEGPFFWNNLVHTVYLDTTYLNSKYNFKPQLESIQDALDAVKCFKEKHIGEKILFVCGSYVIGKEKIWTRIAEEHNLLVWSEANRKKAINCIGDERCLKYLVDNPRDANLHILTLGKLNYDYLKQYLDQFHDQYSILLAIRPSGWEKNSRPQFRGRINIVGIEYSEHSSHSELRRFIRFLQPQKIISTVPQSSDLSQTVKIPNSWYQNEVRSRRKGYQTALTNYIKSTKKQSEPESNDYSNVSNNSCPGSDVGMLDSTEVSIKNHQEPLCDSDYMS